MKQLAARIWKWLGDGMGAPEARGTALVALLVVAPFAWYYFRVVPTSGHFERDAPVFYRNMAKHGRNWLRLEDRELEAALRGQVSDHFHTLVGRTTLERWRLRSVEPRLIEVLLDDYERGAWITPPRERWLELLQAADSAWLDARRASLAQGRGAALSQQLRLVDHEGRVRILFPREITTADLGTRLRVVAQVPADSVSGSYTALWNINDSTERVTYRYLLPRIEAAPAGQDGTFLALEWDFFAEPAWTNPQSRPSFVEISGRIQVSSVVGFQFDDSPRLKP